MKPKVAKKINGVYIPVDETDGRIGHNTRSQRLVNKLNGVYIPVDEVDGRIGHRTGALYFYKSWTWFHLPPMRLFPLRLI